MQMVMSMKVSGKTTKLMAEGSILTLMDLDMRESGKMTNNMALE
jgi:hypothetical protein